MQKVWDYTNKFNVDKTHTHLTSYNNNKRITDLRIQGFWDIALLPR
jgi:hypothetical protein